MTFAAEAGLSLKGAPTRQFVPFLAALSNTLIDAANEDCIMYGQITTSDGASHTLDTSGSIGLRFGAVTSANAGTTVKIGIGDLTAAAGPAARAVNVADVVTFDCSKTMTGAGIITATAWTDFTMDTGSKVIANNQFVAISVQMTALGGADLFNVQTIANATNTGNPGVTGFVGGAYGDQGRSPNAFINFADGAFGWFSGGFVASVGTTGQVWNNGSAQKEYGNIFQVASPQKCYGVMAQISVANDTSFILYSDPLGTPVAEKTIAVDQQQVASAGNLVHYKLFDTPFDLLAGVDYAIVAKPTTATNVTMQYLTMASVAHQRSYSLGATCYAANRNAGAFASQNSGLDRFAIGILVSGGDTGGGSSGGISRARAAGGW